MRQLLLMRHAKSAWDDAGLSDQARPLNARGRAAAAKMRGAMGDLGLAPELVLVSTARRTAETCAALEPWSSPPVVEHLDVLYLADPRQLLAVLHGVAEDVRSVLLIGHNPGMHELAMALAGPSAMTPANEMARRLKESFPSGGLAEFAIPGPWRELGEAGGRLRHFIVPRDLPDPA